MIVSGTLAQAVQEEPAAELLDSRGMSENDREGKCKNLFSISFSIEVVISSFQF